MPLLPDANARMRAQIRPVWRGNEQFEQFTNVDGPAGSAQILTVPVGCTGITVVARNPAIATALFILPTGSVVGGPRIVLDGGDSAVRDHYMAQSSSDPAPVHLLAEDDGAGADADVFYHFD